MVWKNKLKEAVPNLLSLMRCCWSQIFKTIFHSLTKLWRKGKHVDLISGVQVLSMLVSYSDEEPNNSRKNSSDDYCSCEGEERYKVSVGTYLEFRSHNFNKYHSNIFWHFYIKLIMTRIPVAELSSVYFLNYRLLSKSIDSPATASHVPLNLAKMQWQTPRHSPSHGLPVCLFVFHAVREWRDTNWIVFVASFQIFSVCRPDLWYCSLNVKCWTKI